MSLVKKLSVFLGKKKITVFEFYMMSLGFQDVSLFERVQVGGGVDGG